MAPFAISDGSGNSSCLTRTHGNPTEVEVTAAVLMMVDAPSHTTVTCSVVAVIGDIIKSHCSRGMASH